MYSAGATVTGGYDLSRFYDSRSQAACFFSAGVAVMYRPRLCLISGIGLSWSRSTFAIALSIGIKLLSSGGWCFLGVERIFSKRWLDIARGRRM